MVFLNFVNLSEIWSLNFVATSRHKYMKTFNFEWFYKKGTTVFSSSFLNITTGPPFFQPLETIISINKTVRQHCYDENCRKRVEWTRVERTRVEWSINAPGNLVSDFLKWVLLVHIAIMCRFSQSVLLFLSTSRSKLSMYLEHTYTYKYYVYLYILNI